MTADPDRSELVHTETAFTQAIDLPAGERERFIERLDATDPATARAVRGLLAAHDALPAFPDGTLEPGTGSLPAGAIVGRFQVVRLVGGGSAAEVYEARRVGPVAQRVALKILRPGMGSVDLLARFDEERETLAQLDLPGLAAVIDAGATADGRPWFAMPFVDGVPITRYCDEHTLTVRDRLDLVRALCEAMSLAHRRGIVHRDLTPSNILVTQGVDGPRPVVVDFGIAKALGRPRRVDSEFHAHRKILGTPAYMAPEQTRPGSPIGPPADVFSLGSLMTELLCGHAPLEAATADALPVDDLYRRVRESPRRSPWALFRALPEAERHAVARARRTTPAALESALRREPSWIATRAMELDADRRYADAGAMALDLARLRDGQPLEAGPRTGAYVLRSLLRQHRRKVVAAALVLGALVAGSVVSLVLAARAQRAEEALARRNDELLALVQQQVRDLVGALALVPNTVSARKDLLERSVATLRRLSSDREAGPDETRILAASLNELADVLGDPRHSNLGDVDQCLAVSALALEAWTRVGAADASDPAPHRMIGLNAMRIANLLFERRSSDAHEWYDRAAASFERQVRGKPSDELVGFALVQFAFTARQRVQLMSGAADGSPCTGCPALALDTERRLRAMAPAELASGQPSSWAEALVSLAEVWVFAGAPAEATRLYAEATPFVERAMALHPESVKLRLLRSAMLRGEARAAGLAGERSRSIGLLERASSLVMDPALQPPVWYAVPVANTRVLVFLELTEAFCDVGDLAGALRAAGDACRLAREALALEPENASSRDFLEKALRTGLAVLGRVLDEDTRTPRAGAGDPAREARSPGSPSAAAILDALRTGLGWCEEWECLPRPNSVSAQEHEDHRASVARLKQRILAQIEAPGAPTPAARLESTPDN
jgi:serine/threonine protein kinase